MNEKIGINIIKKQILKNKEDQAIINQEVLKKIKLKMQLGTKNTNLQNNFNKRKINLKINKDNYSLMRIKCKKILNYLNMIKPS